jgi:hypothetical protein
MALETILVDTSPPPKYQPIGSKAAHLHQLGLSNAAIARRLDATGKTVAKAIRWHIDGTSGRT